MDEGRQGLRSSRTAVVISKDAPPPTWPNGSCGTALPSPDGSTTCCQSLLAGQDISGELAGVAPDPRVGMLPVGDGWLTWITDRTGDEELTGAGARVHLQERDGDLVRLSWPTRPVSRIAERLRTYGPDERFPAVVRAHLEEAGWYPGRRYPERELETWVAGRPAVEGIVLHDAARSALAEFGGLRIGAAAGRDVEFFPHPCRTRGGDEPQHSPAGEMTLAYPVADDHQQRSGGLVLVAADSSRGTTVIVEADHDLLVGGDSIDEMLIKYLTGDRFDVVG